MAQNTHDYTTSTCKIENALVPPYPQNISSPSAVSLPRRSLVQLRLLQGCCHGTSPTTILIAVALKHRHFTDRYLDHSHEDLESDSSEPSPDPTSLNSLLTSTTQNSLDTSNLTTKRQTKCPLFESCLDYNFTPPHFMRKYPSNTRPIFSEGATVQAGKSPKARSSCGTIWSGSSSWKSGFSHLEASTFGK